jgi:non-specific serine/threonine protein kinase
LVTLTGPGGVGKTRLALQIAADLAGKFVDGVRFVDLTPIRDPDLVPSAIGQALGFREAGDRSVIDLLVDHLQNRKLLLVLDNLEQVIEAAPFISDLLTVCLGLTVLATSRTRLNLGDEFVYPVARLDLPNADRATATDVADAAAVRLFVERAQRVQPAFRLEAANAALVAEICRRLDGLPLAIELAAARVGLLAPSHLLARLEQSLPLLTGGPRDAPDRQRTMRDAIAWSYDLLPPGTQILFRRLAVFVGGFTPATVDVVASVTPDGDVLGGIADLVEQSLLYQVEGEDSGPRFAMLETVREYGLDRLSEADEERAVRDRHVDWCFAFVNSVERNLRGPDQSVWLERFGTELGNLRAALEWTAARADAASLCPMVADSWMAWTILGHFAEARSWIERALSLRPEPGTAHHARLLCLAVESDRQFGDEVSAMARAEAAVASARELDDPILIGQSLLHLAHASADRGDPIARREALAEEAHRVLRDAVPGHWLVAAALADLAWCARQRDDLDRAEALGAEALALRRALGGPWGVAAMLELCGDIARLRGDRVQAASLWREALALRWNIRDVGGVLSSLWGFGELATTEGQFADAARWYGTASALREHLGLTYGLEDRVAFDEDVARIRNALDAEAFALAWEEGRSTTIDEAVTRAMAWSTPDDCPTVESSHQTPASRFGLSTRELDVLRLIAAGLHDREIAETLFVSPRTVNTHTARIYAKLGVGSRAEATAWAVRHGLV